MDAPQALTGLAPATLFPGGTTRRCTPASASKEGSGRLWLYVGEGASVQLPSHLHCNVVTDARIAVTALAHERDGLGNDVVRCQEKVGESLAAVGFEDVDHACVIFVVLADVGEEEARVEEDHSSGLP